MTLSLSCYLLIQLNLNHGIDVGLEKFLTTSEGDGIEIPQFDRKAQDKLAKAQRVMSRRVKGSKNWQKAKKKVALLHLRLTRCRKEFHYQVAHWLCGKYDLIAHVGASLPTLGGIDLNIKGLARTRLAKSIHDAAWGAFLEILQAVAVTGLPDLAPVAAVTSSNAVC